MEDLRKLEQKSSESCHLLTASTFFVFAAVLLGNPEIWLAIQKREYYMLDSVYSKHLNCPILNIHSITAFYQEINLRKVMYELIGSLIKIKRGYIQTLVKCNLNYRTMFF